MTEIKMSDVSKRKLTNREMFECFIVLTITIVICLRFHGLFFFHSLSSFTCFQLIYPFLTLQHAFTKPSSLICARSTFFLCELYINLSDVKLLYSKWIHWPSRHPIRILFTLTLKKRKKTRKIAYGKAKKQRKYTSLELCILLEKSSQTIHSLSHTIESYISDVDLFLHFIFTPIPFNFLHFSAHFLTVIRSYFDSYHRLMLQTQGREEEKNVNNFFFFVIVFTNTELCKML